VSVGSDPRSRKVAVVAESLLPTLLDRLDEEGYGVIQLPPAGLDDETAGLWLEQVAEHVAEFDRNDYEVVLADDGAYAEALGKALSALAVPPLEEYVTQ
jgi:hypothetical protein